MNKAVTKLAALFLALAMTLTLLPGAAFAQGEETAQALAVTEGAPAEQPAEDARPLMSLEAVDPSGATPRQTGTLAAQVYTGPFDKLVEDQGYNNTGMYSTYQGNGFVAGVKEDGVLVSMDRVEFKGATKDDAAVDGSLFIVTKGGDNGIPGLAETYMNVSIDDDAPVGEYILTFTVDGAADGTGGTDVALRVNVQAGVYPFASQRGGTWNWVFGPLMTGVGQENQICFSATSFTQNGAKPETLAASLTKAELNGKALTIGQDNISDGETVCLNYTAADSTFTLTMQQKGAYTLTFEVTKDGTAYPVSLTMRDPSSGNPGGNMAQAQCTEPLNENNWMTTQGRVLAAGERLFLRVVQNNESLPFVLSQPAGTENTVRFEPAENNTYKITGGSVNGAVQLTLALKSGQTLPFTVTVTGNKVDPVDPDPGYVAAAVAQAVQGENKTVTFANVTGELAGNSDEAFTLANGTLSFDSAGKAPGLYEATVGGRKYVVAVMKPIQAGPAAQTVTMTEFRPAGLPGNSGMPDGIYASDRDSSGMASVQSAIQLKFQVNAQGQADPIYLYRGLNGKLVSMEGYHFSLFSPWFNAADYFTGEAVTLQDGSTAYKLSVNAGVPASANLPAYVVISDQNDNFVGSVEFSLTGAYADSFGFTTDPSLAGGNNTLALRAIDQRFTVGNGCTATRYYLTLGSGDNGNMQPARYDLALYDDIKIGTFTVTSSAPDFAKVTGYLSSTPQGKNAIGFEVQVLDDSAPRYAEITVSFEDAAGFTHVYKGVVLCSNVPQSQVKPVANVEEFQAAYNSMTSGTIVMQGGTYSMDLVNCKPIAIQAAPNAEVIINGDPNSPEGSPIVTVGLSNPGEITGVIIDGRDRTRAGIDANGSNGYAFDITIRDCTVGIQNGGADYWSLQAINATFVNNGIAVKGDAAALRVEECAFEGNDVAVEFAMNSYINCWVHMNKFLNNGTDFLSMTTSDPTATQNYYDHDGSKAPVTRYIAPGIGVNGKVYYSPWFTDEAMTLYTADLAGAVPGGTGYTVPVDRTLSAASLLDNALFEEMESAGESVAVSIPVTEKVGDKALVTTVWGFDSKSLADSLPAQMDLEVTDALSPAAQKVVNAVVANPDAIAQAVNFSHDGALPGTATVMVRKTGDMKAEDLKLYYINEATGTVEQAEIVAVSETTLNGVDYYVVTVAHCSEYLIAGAITLKEEGGSTGGESAPAPTATPTATPTAAPTAAPTEAPAATPVPTRAPASANQLVSALEVEERFADAQGDEVSFDVARKPLVSAGAFGILARNPGKTLVLEGEGYAWSFKGAALTDPGAIEGASFDTTVSLTSPNAHLIAPLVKDVPVVNLYFSYHGALPGPAQVSVQLSAEQANTVKFLYHFNPTAVVLEYVGEATVDASGVATFTIEHCSDYVLLDEKLEDAPAAPEATQAPAPTQAPEATQAPASQQAGTGGVGFILAAAAAVVALAAVILLVMRRRKGE